jgi:hypothetical protein
VFPQIRSSIAGEHGILDEVNRDDLKEVSRVQDHGRYRRGAETGLGRERCGLADLLELDDRRRRRQDGSLARKADEWMLAVARAARARMARNRRLAEARQIWMRRLHSPGSPLDSW